MSIVGPLIIGGLAVLFAVTTIILLLKNAKLRQLHEDTAAKLADVSAWSETLRQTNTQIEPLRSQAAHLSKKLDEAYAEDKQKVTWLDHQQQEIDWLRVELEKRPKVHRKTYKILTLGVKGTGKTSLTLKWANPLTDLGLLQGTKIERYERTVSHVANKDVITEHVFEVGDWGGEHIVDAQQELVVEEIHGLLIVVDLTGTENNKFDAARVEDQLREFQPQALKYFFSPKTVASCKSVVLFINKSDVLAGTPLEVERLARHHYGRLIQDLERYQGQIDVRVFVGSASYGHNVHHLFSHFVERILPKNAYDTQLLQRMKTEGQATTSAKFAALAQHAMNPPTNTGPLPGMGEVPYVNGGTRPVAKLGASNGR